MGLFGNNAAAPMLFNGEGMDGGYFGPGGSQLTDMLGQTDPWGLFHKEKMIDTTGAKPDIPGYNSIRDSNGGLLSQYKYNPTDMLQTGRLDNRARDAMRNRALGKGPSEWAGLMDKKINMQTAGLKDQASVDNMASRQGAMDAAATRGGLMAGSAGRIASRGMINDVNGQQQANNWGATGKANVAIEDERQKLDLMKVIPGMDLQAAQYDTYVDAQNAGIANDAAKFNTQSQLGDVQDQNKSDLFKYGQQMQGYGADKTADATINAGKKGKMQK